MIVFLVSMLIGISLGFVFPLYHKEAASSLEQIRNNAREGRKTPITIPVIYIAIVVAIAYGWYALGVIDPVEFFLQSNAYTAAAKCAFSIVTVVTGSAFVPMMRFLVQMLKTR